MDDILYKQECYNIVGAAMAVYNDKGHGFLEPVYQECMEIELGIRNIQMSAQVPFPLAYRGRALKQKYVADLVCYEQIIVEVKAVSALCDSHRSQVLNYLKASGLELGLLINFGHPGRLEYERIVRTHAHHGPQ